MKHERWETIIKLLQTERMIKVPELIERFGVSNETIRRDLEALERDGYLQRVYGGAVVRSMYGQEPSYTSREIKNYIEKVRIAQRAVDFIEDGDTLIIDLGTTTLQFAKALRGKRKVTVLTGAMLVAMELVSDPDIRVILIGGDLRGGDLSTSGFLAEETVAQFNVDKLILGVGGLTAEHGVTDYHIEEASVRRYMVKHSREVIALADHSKLGVTALNAICPASAVKMLITDDRADVNILDQIRDTGASVIRVTSDVLTDDAVGTRI